MMLRNGDGVVKPAKCEKCGSRVFFVNETSTCLEVDGEIIKALGEGGLNNRNCVRCTYPKLYAKYGRYEVDEGILPENNS